jgi:Sortilin, neurotensin receptor 3,
MSTTLTLTKVHETDTDVAGFQNPGAAVISTGELIVCYQHGINSGNANMKFLASRDYGTTWETRTPVIGHPINGGVRMANLPGNVLLFPVGDANDNVTQIMRSTDGARSWNVVADFNPAQLLTPVKYVAGFATYNRTSAIAYGILARSSADGFDSMIARSTDAGATWARENGNTTGGMNSITYMLAPGPGGLVFACNATNGVYKSTDNGATWTGPLSLPAPPDATQTFPFCATCITDQIILVGGRYNKPSGNYDSYLYRSTDAGATWTRVSSSSISNWPATDAQIAILEIHRLTKRGAILTFNYNLVNTNIPMSFSVDAGLTWNAPTIAGGWQSANSYPSGAIVVAPDGGIIIPAAVRLGGGGFKFQIWRGRVS